MKLFAHWKPGQRNLLRDSEGAVLPLAGISLIVIAALAGGAIDMARMATTRDRLQNACDAAVLAGRKTVRSNGFDSVAQAAAQNYFRANFREGLEGTSGTTITLTSPDNGVSVIGSASTKVAPTVSSLIGIEDFPISVNCGSVMDLSNLDITFALDMSSSMTGAMPGTPITKITALRNAMNLFYRTVTDLTQGSNIRIRYAMVPYSNSVNVGAILYEENPDYLVNKRKIQSLSPVFDAAKKFQYYSYRQVEWDTSTYKTFATIRKQIGPNGTYVDTTWNGCIEERATIPASSFSYDPVNGIQPAGALDLDLDLKPVRGQPNTQWSPMWEEVGFVRMDAQGNLTNNSTSRYGKNTTRCSTRATLLQEMTEAEFRAYANSLKVGGRTYHDLGMIWAGRISSPTGIFSDTVTADPGNGGNVSRHIILMADGSNYPGHDEYSAYGIEFHDRRITTDGSISSTRHDSRFRAVCAAVRAKGIRVWVIAVSTELTSTLKSCASSDSSFTADSTEELSNVFAEIGRKVGELRVVQ